ncbi:MAG: fused MFS/spermidine synthase [Desulfovibrionaceae bacterium]|nr:fused MFS/spermidine synthase [Desulfovibrionaceae bacterium]
MLAIVVFLNGMAVMVLEMAGARLLAPELGTSIIVWTSLIGVILANLSLGYWLGGKLADKVLRLSGGKGGEHAFAVLSRLLALAAISAFMAAALGVFIPGAVRGAIPSLHLGTVCAAIALFALPAVLCGMVSSYAVRLGITSGDTAGAAIGRLNAIGTVGSIVGTFLGGFVLLAWFSTGAIILGVAACLLLAAFLVRVRPIRSKALIGLIILAGIIGSESYASWVAGKGFSEGVPITVDTPYASMRVAKGRQGSRDALLLMTDPGSAQSGMFEDDPLELLFEYTHFYGLGTAMNPGAGRILMLGGGGYSVPKWLLGGRSDLRRDDFRLDVVELDPGMTGVAERYFKAPLDDPRMRVFHEDARTFINRAAAAVPEGEAGPYDLIFADIFNSWYTVPFHVGTVEAARNIHRLLADDGIYVMNIITAISGDNGRLLRSIRSAFLESFAEAHIFPVQHKLNSGMIQNVMLLAFKTPRALPDPAKESVPVHIARMLENRWTSPFPAPENDVPALRDDFAPVERYTLGFVR